MRGGLQTACTTPAIRRHGGGHHERGAVETRKFVLDMLLTDHPNDCMICEVAGDCELQDLVYDYGVKWPEPNGESAPRLRDQSRPQSLHLHRPQQVHPLRTLHQSLQRNPEPGRVVVRLPRVRDQVGGRSR